MNRRTFLAAAGVAGAGALAGCSAIGGPTRLSNPERSATDGGQTSLTFSADGSRLATLTVSPPRRSTGGPLPVDVHLSHRDGTTVDSLTLELRAPPAGAAPSAQVSLVIPQWSPVPAIQLYTTDDGRGRVVEIDDTNGQGGGTLTLRFLVDGGDRSLDELAVRASADLSASGLLGDSYEIDGHTRVPLPGANG